MNQPVSLCMIVRNEEATLPTCLRSVADLVAEMVVVDTGSADRTKEVAADLGARVHDFPWQDDFAAARNESLRLASSAWVFWLDADEFLDEADREKLRSLFASLKDENAAFVMVQRSLLPTGSASRVPQVRLFRRHPAVCWEYRVHEQLLPSLRRAGHAVRGTDIVIQHSGYRQPSAGPGKLQRNVRLLLLDQQERLGRRGQALAWVRQGQVRCPGERSLLFLEGQLQRAVGKVAACGQVEAGPRKSLAWELIVARGPLSARLLAV